MMIEKLLQAIDAWMHAGQVNYLVYFAIIAIVMAASFAVWRVYDKKIGAPDERSDMIKLRAGYITFGFGFTIIVLFVSFLLDAKVEYASQLMLIPLAITFVVGAVVTFVQYRRHN